MDACDASEGRWTQARLPWVWVTPKALRVGSEHPWTLLLCKIHLKRPRWGRGLCFKPFHPQMLPQGRGLTPRLPAGRQLRLIPPGAGASSCCCILPGGFHPFHAAQRRGSSCAPAAPAPPSRRRTTRGGCLGGTHHALGTTGMELSSPSKSSSNWLPAAGLGNQRLCPVGKRGGGGCRGGFF